MAPPDFIDGLVSDLLPVRPAASWSRSLATWAVISWAIVAALIFATGPLREGALNDVLASPRSVAELLLGSAAGLAAIWAALELGVPGGPCARRLLVPPFLALVAWLAILAFGLAGSSPEPSMLGKREHCVWQTLLFALPPLAIALVQLQRRTARSSLMASCIAGMASATIPAVWMQVACMDSARHTLTHHLPPILGIGLIGFFAGALAMNRR